MRLTATEFKLLALPGSSLRAGADPPRLFYPTFGDRQILTSHVEYLRVYIGQLRKKLEDDPDHPHILTTEPGIGYRFIIEG